MAGEISGKQLRASSIPNTKLAAGILSADSTGRALMASGLFDEATVDAKFAAGAIDTDRLKEGSGFIKSDGTVAMAAALAMGTQRITGLAQGINPSDAATKAQVDSAIAGLDWKEPIQVSNLLGNVTLRGLVGNLGAATIEGLTPSSGDAYVVNNVSGGEAPAGALIGATVGDIWQYTGAAWAKIVTGVGGFVPANTFCLLGDESSTALIAPFTTGTDTDKRAQYTGGSLSPAVTLDPVDGGAYVIDGSGALNEGAVKQYNGSAYIQLVNGVGGFVPTTLRAMIGLGSASLPIQPYINGTDDGKIVDFSGSSNTGADTGDATNGAAVFVDGQGDYEENTGYVYDGVVASGTWVKFTGIGQLIAGDGLNKSGNTLDVVASDFAGNGLEDDGSNNLRVKPDSAATDDAAAVAVGANGLSIDGDVVSIDQVPTNYTRSFAGTGVDVKDLASHLQGIDDKLGAIVTGAMTSSDKKLTPAACAADDSDTGLDIASTPDGWVGVYVNTLGPYELGDGATNRDCYFSSNGLPGGVRSIANIVAGDSLVWNAVIAGFSLDGVNDRIDLVYEV